MAEQHEQHILNLERQLLGEDANRFQSPSATSAASFSNVMSYTNSPSNVISVSASPSNPGFETFSTSHTPNILATSGRQFDSPTVNYDSFTKPNPFEASTDLKPQVNQGQALGDSEFISEWKTNIKTIIAQRDEYSQEKSKQALKQAKNDLDSYYQEYNQNKEAQIAKNKSNKGDDQQQSIVGTFWQKVDKQIELTNTSFESQKKLINGTSNPNLSMKTSLSSVISELSISSDEKIPPSCELERIYDNSIMQNLISNLSSDPLTTDPKGSCL
ncbi:hypothetical protein BB561_003706 [Smittium simulii]|uniref:Clathrin light chain n=1 Tax=Smittium simulii TaxID=133385 RepID=A0A2T9YJY6_9FUNG|nr:hypothetical protein BB561_003706 [Smittium simulii]